MADAIRKEFDVNPEMIEGRGGVFDVHVDGRQVWSKHETGRFPEHHEVIDRIHRLQASGRRQ